MNYGDARYFTGLLLIEDSFMVEYVDNPEFTWVDEMLSWNPCNDFARPRTIQVPSAKTICDGRHIIGHPETIRRLKQQMKQDREYTDATTTYTDS
jgi:hypothetical protein